MSEDKGFDSGGKVGLDFSSIGGELPANAIVYPEEGDEKDMDAAETGAVVDDKVAAKDKEEAGQDESGVLDDKKEEEPGGEEKKEQAAKFDFDDEKKADGGKKDEEGGGEKKTAEPMTVKHRGRMVVVDPSEVQDLVSKGLEYSANVGNHRRMIEFVESDPMVKDLLDGMFRYRAGQISLEDAIPEAMKALVPKGDHAGPFDPKKYKAPDPEDDEAMTAYIGRVVADVVGKVNAAHQTRQGKSEKKQGGLFEDAPAQGGKQADPRAAMILQNMVSVYGHETATAIADNIVDFVNSELTGKQLARFNQGKWEDVKQVMDYMLAKNPSLAKGGLPGKSKKPMFKASETGSEEPAKRGGKGTPAKAWEGSDEDFRRNLDKIRHGV